MCSHGRDTMVLEDTPESPNKNPAFSTTNAFLVAETAATNPSTTAQQKQEDDPWYNLCLKEGLCTPGDSGVSPDCKPDWLDVEKFRAGQRFAQEYFFGLVFSQMLSLFLLFAAPDSLHPLIFSGNSDTPFKAFKRYLSTVVRVRSWYSADPWNRTHDASRNLLAVRAMHDKYRRALHDAVNEDTNTRIALRGPLWDEGAHALLRQDAAAAMQKNPGIAQCPLARALGRMAENQVRISQSEMTVTQFGFVGLMALYPHRFGAGGATEEELEGFVHVWRVIGYLLGIEDRFNLCNAGLKGVRERSRYLIRQGFLPMFASVGADWEHMLRCVLEGISYYVGKLSLQISMMYLCDIIDLPIPHFYATITFREKIAFYITKFMMCFVLRVRYLRNIFNRSLDIAIKKAENASPDWLKKRQDRVYSYQI